MAINKDQYTIEVDELRIKYTNKTGKILPMEFWQYWTDWHRTCNSGNVDQAKILCNHPNVQQYGSWMEMVKTIMKTDGSNKKDN